MEQDIYIVDGSRSPFCKLGTTFKDMNPTYIASDVVKNLIKDIDASIIDEVVFGCVAQPADSMNIARHIAMHAGIPIKVPAVSVHRNCGSGMEAITYCSDKIRAGAGDIYIAGGVESMTRMPFLYNKSAVTKFSNAFRQKKAMGKILSMLKFRPSDFLPDIGLKLGLSDTLCDMNMGQTAELLAREYSISRVEQDSFALLSHERAITGEDKLREEITPIYLRKDDCIKTYTGEFVDKDNGPRPGGCVTKLGNLRPVFDREGTVTPGNSSQLTDGAAALILMSRRGLKMTGAKAIAKITKYGFAGCEPERMGLGPVEAIRKCKLDPSKADLIEINEAFAAQTLAVIKQLNIDGSNIIDSKVNVNGGSIALGHPVGASGARITLTLIKELRRRNLNTGLATLCIGGGQGGALWVETC